MCVYNIYIYIPVCIWLQRFRQILKELIWNLRYTDEDQKSETVVYSYQVMESVLIWFEKKTFNICIYMYLCVHTHAEADYLSGNYVL